MTTPDPGTDTTTAAEPPDDDAAVDQPQEPPEQEPATANAEAARYRTQLRKAEAQIAAMAAERDALGERVAAYQRHACEQVAADLLDQASDLWLFGDDPADFYDGDVLEEDKLRAAVAGLLDKRPGLAKTAPRGPARWGQYGSMPPAASADWGQVLKH